MTNTVPHPAEGHSRRLLRVRDTIDRDFAQPWSVAELAAIALLSPTHFRRQFNALFGLPPLRYLQRRRIERAQDLLLGTDLEVTEIAGRVGYESLGTFTRIFTELVGDSPGRYRAGRGAAAVPACFVRSHVPLRFGEPHRFGEARGVQGHFGEA